MSNETNSVSGIDEIDEFILGEHACASEFEARMAGDLQLALAVAERVEFLQRVSVAAERLPAGEANLPQRSARRGLVMSAALVAVAATLVLILFPRPPVDESRDVAAVERDLEQFAEVWFAMSDEKHDNDLEPEGEASGLFLVDDSEPAESESYWIEAATQMMIDEGGI